MKTAGPVLGFLCVAGLALVVFRVVDAGLFAVLPQGLKVLADIRVTSLLLLVALCLAVPSARPFLAAPRALPSRSVRVACAVVVGAAFFLPLLTGTGRVDLPRLEDRVAFHLFGALNEELLCRGLMLGAALQVFTPAPTLSPLRQRAVIATAIVFSLMHAQHQGFVLGPALYAQLSAFVWVCDSVGPVGVVQAFVTDGTDANPVGQQVEDHEKAEPLYFHAPIFTTA